MDWIPFWQKCSQTSSLCVIWLWNKKMDYMKNSNGNYKYKTIEVRNKKNFQNRTMDFAKNSNFVKWHFYKKRYRLLMTLLATKRQLPLFHVKYFNTVKQSDGPVTRGESLSVKAELWEESLSLSDRVAFLSKSKCENLEGCPNTTSHKN